MAREVVIGTILSEGTTSVRIAMLS